MRKHSYRQFYSCVPEKSAYERSPTLASKVSVDPGGEIFTATISLTRTQCGSGCRSTNPIGSRMLPGHPQSDGRASQFEGYYQVEDLEDLLVGGQT